MLKQRLIAVIAGIALIIAVASTAVGVGNTLVNAATPAVPAIACTAQSGGGC